MENSFSFWKNLFFVIIFFTLTPVALLTSLFSLVSLSKVSQKNTAPVAAAFDLTAQTPTSGVKVFASLPVDFHSVSGYPEVSDARAQIIKQYLEKYNSPLSPYSDHIVAAADQYKIDFRLTTAIARQESNLCKLIPPESFNCWGWGIHSAGTLGFSSFEEGINAVTMGLASNYIYQGLNTPEKIMAKYTPLSDGSWARAVTQFLSEME